MLRKVLLVDDEENVRELLGLALRRHGYEVVACATAGEALERYQQENFPAVVLDLHLPDGDGLELLHRLRALNEETQVILITAYAEVRSAVQAMKLGAYDYLPKPFEAAELEAVLDKAFQVLEMRARLAWLERTRPASPAAELIGVSPAMRELFRLIHTVAAGPSSTILITGESGTGKELVARAIHAHSSRAAGPLVTVNCTLLKAEFLESELFGHERGAFTDAREPRKGLLEVADGGTVFLDEIGEMDLHLQAKLLRVLEERFFRRLGGNREIRVDIRVLAATNKDLAAAVRMGRFREDLFFRLQVIPIHLVPLRERREDILPLARHFLEIYARELGKRMRDFTPEAQAILRAYPWPGNVRELRNLMERIALLERCDIVGLENLPAELAAERKSGDNPAPPGTRARVSADFERRYLEDLLQRNSGNISRSAREAGLRRTSLQRLIRTHGLQPDTYRPQS